MNIDLLSIIDNEGSKLTFNGEVDTSDYNISVNSKITGKVINFSGRLELTANVTSTVTTVCARCVAPLTANLEFEISEIVGEDEVTLSGTTLDIGSIVDRNVIINMPMKYLCRDDCKGLCAQCGANLNIEQCKCSGDEIDERFAALKKLLD